MKCTLILIAFCTFNILPLISQQASIYEEKHTMKTYGFSQPDPVPNIGRIYPYFRFDGYTSKGIDKEWKMVVMENDYIKAYITPDIGGKIWGAIEKSTRHEFLYFNEVVKFRDIAMRGPWTSGGLEYNFGDIGHIPTASTPVDYVMKKYPDGSVACVVGALDLPSRTKWNVEIRLYPNKAFLETHVIWDNPTDLPVTYYHWMNAAAKASGNLEFIYPGNARIGHNGEIGDFPIDNNRNISFYEKNNFGPYKSYHVLNAYSNFFGGYWHDDDFGFGHESNYDEKPGKKIWIWGLSGQGMIWEDLLTDDDGQYVEYQAGKLFNQASEGSTNTPFKHGEFIPHDQDRMTERWFPLLGTGGIDAASEYGVIKTARNGRSVNLTLSALQSIDDTLYIISRDKYIIKEHIQLEPLQLYQHTFQLDHHDHFNAMVGDHLLTYSSDPADLYVERPLHSEVPFNWDNVFGKFLLGLEAEKQRKYLDAYTAYQECLEMNPNFLPAINRLALSYFRMGQYQPCRDWIMKALAIDTYDAEANYIYGLVCEQLNDVADAKSGFSISTQHPAYRVPAYNALAKLYLKEGNYRQSLHYCNESLHHNVFSTQALKIKTLIYRYKGQKEDLKETLLKLEEIDGTSTFIANERGLLTGQDHLTGLITNELPHETYMELAMSYLKYGDRVQALKILRMIEDYPIAGLWMAHLYHDKTLLEHYLTSDIDMVFPHRMETLNMLEALIKINDHWKLKYMAALIYWNKGRINKAKMLFDQCGEDPDFVAFYLARAELFDTEAYWISSIDKALDIDPNHWRANLAFAERLINQDKFKEAESVSERFLKINPAFGMIYARSLIGQKKPVDALNFLSNYEILPYEGARAGRALYHESAILSALQAWNKKDTDSVIEYAKKAKLWPGNLGSGRPYDVDEREEDYILWKGYEKKKDISNTNRYRMKLQQYAYNPKDPADHLILQYIASDHMKRKDIINNIDSKNYESLIQWITSIENDESNIPPPKEGSIIEQIITTIK